MSLIKTYKCIALIGLFIISFSADAQKRKKHHSDKDSLSKMAIIYEPVCLVDSIVDYALPFQNTPYKYAGKQPGGFDCSGFMCYVFSSKGFKMPSSSREIKTVGEEISKDKIKVGDVVYFTGRNAKSNIPGHVGMVIKIDANNEIWFIHASVMKGVCVDAVSQDYYSKRFLGARRIVRE